MSTIKISFPNNITKDYEVRTKGLNILENFGGDASKIIAIKVNNEIMSLCRPIRVSCAVEPVFASSRAGAEIYRRSLCFVLAVAAHRLFPKTRLLVGHSLGYGYYYTLDREVPITDVEIKNLDAEMRKIIAADMQILTEHISYEEACETFEKLNLIETRKQLECR